MSLLLLSIAALMAGPIVVGLVGSSPHLRRGLDGYVLVTIGGLVGLHLLPMALHDAGPWALLAMALGAAGPWLIERQLTTEPSGAAHTGSTLFAIGGLALHALIDGAALATPGDAHGHVHAPLALAVIVHRLPMGLLVWWAVSEVAGRAGVVAMLGLMVIGTVVGYVASEPVLARLPPFGAALFIALVAGALLHVLTHAMRGPREPGGPRWPLALGGVLGAATVATLTALGG